MGVRLKHFWDNDARFGLIVLQQSGKDARQGECTAIERMAELWFASIRRAIAQFQAIRLEGLKVRD